MIGHDVIWPKILPGPIRGLCVDARPKRGFWSWEDNTEMRSKLDRGRHFIFASMVCFHPRFFPQKMLIPEIYNT